MPIEYNPDRPFLVLFRWNGTIMPLVFMRRDTWIFMILHIILFVLRKFGDADKASTFGRTMASFPSLPFEIVTPGTTLLVFFAVFYNNQCFERYQNMYNWCCAINGKCLEFVALLKCYIDPSRQGCLYNSIRMLLASVFIHYHTLTGESMDDLEWQSLIDKHLLYEDEMNMVKEYKGKKVVLLFTWCLQVTKHLLDEEMQAVHLERVLKVTYDDNSAEPRAIPLATKQVKRSKAAAIAAGEDFIEDTPDQGPPNADASEVDVSGVELKMAQDPNLLAMAMSHISTTVEFESLERVIMDVKSLSTAINNELANPLPFPYWHVLNLMMSVNYFMMAYCLAFLKVQTYFSIPLLLLFIIIVSGLREVGSQLADPFGDDAVDFDVDFFLKQTYTATLAALHHEYVPDHHRADPVKGTPPQKLMDLVNKDGKPKLWSC